METNLADPVLYPLLVEEARRMKFFPTDAERVFWELVRRKNLGVTFRRQYVIDQFIVDFVCLKAGLVVEIDGSIHLEEEHQRWDEWRTQRLNSMGFVVLRFTNEEVLCDTDKVIKKVKTYLK